MSSVTLTVTLEGEVGKHEVQGSEAAIQVVVNLRVILSDGLSDLLALESTRSSENRDFGHDLQDIESAPFVNIVHLEDLETGVALHKLSDLLLYHANVLTEVVRRQTELDKLLLFHEEFVGAVIDDVFTKDWRSEVLLKVSNTHNSKPKEYGAPCRHPLQRKLCAFRPK